MLVGRLIELVLSLLLIDYLILEVIYFISLYIYIILLEYLL